MMKKFPNWLLHIFHWIQRNILEPAEAKYHAKKMMCSARGSTLTGFCQSDEACDVEEKKGSSSASPSLY